jgi:hypothetical protein
MRLATVLTIATFAAAPSGGAQAESVYTSIDLDRCETLATYEDGGFRARCEGHLGLDVFVSEGDARMDVDYGVDSEHFETFSAFNSVGETIEWLIGPYGAAEAAIVRFNINVDGRSAQALVVSQVGSESEPGCVIGVVDAALEQANGMARGIGSMARTFDCAIDPVVVPSGARELVRGFTSVNGVAGAN